MRIPTGYHNIFSLYFKLEKIAHNVPQFLRLWPDTVFKEDSITEKSSFQEKLLKTGQCPPASKIQPRNDEDFASARAKAPIRRRRQKLC